MKRLQAVFACVFIISFISTGFAQQPNYDLVIRNGRIVDGTGNPWFEADIAVQGDRIVKIARNISNGDGKKVLDATGMMVAPGFIDIHSHSDFYLFEDGSAQSKIRQGVTTDVLGEGSSAGPNQIKRSPREQTIHDKKLKIATLADYFHAIDTSTVSINVASYVGLSTIWKCVMGDSFDQPTTEQLEQMKQLVRQAMQDGALGLSSQLMSPPGSNITTDQVVEICKVIAPFGGIYSTHIRNEGTGVFDSVQQAIEIGERAGVPVDIIHLKIADQRYWGRMNEVVALIQAARDRGLNVQANVYPYTRGNNNLVSIIPPWAHEGGRSELIKRLKDPKLRTRMKKEITEEQDEWYNHYLAVGGNWSRMLVSGNNRFKGLTMDRVIALRTQGQKHVDSLDELFDFLIEEEGSVGTVYAHHTESDMNLAMLQPWCSIGSDGSALAVKGPLRRGNPHPRNFGTFPRVLGLYVRQRSLFRIEDAIRKMTSLNATKVGIMDRGLLRAGFFADLVVFDARRIIDLATYTDPFRYNRGIKYVIVNGKITLDGDQHTGVRAGRALRKKI